MNKSYWLMKCEPGAYSIDDLKRDKKTYWEGVRNYQARNFLRDELKAGDLAFFYHSNAEPSGIAGIMEIVREGYADPSQFDPKSRYYDPESKRENPRWYVVDVKFIKKLPTLIPLSALRAKKELKGMPLLQPGQRLSIQPVTKERWQITHKLIQEL